MPQATRMSYTHCQKRAIIRNKIEDPHISLERLAVWAKTEFHLPKRPAKSTIQTILKAQDWLLQQPKPDDEKDMRRKHIKCMTIEVKLLAWIVFAESKGFFVNQQLMRLQARAFCRQGGLQHGLSNGWLYKFQKRHNLRLCARPGESFSVHREAIEAGRTWLKKVTSEFSRANTFNFDETALYYSAFPKRSICSQAMSGFKNDKSRLNVGLGANANGTEKLEPVFIGKSKEPLCVRRAGRFGALDLQYYDAKKGWMTGKIFQAWFERLEEQFKAAHRHILLLVDNVSSHRLFSVQLEFVHVVFLPPRTTFVLQPMDAGVIAAFKKPYKSRQMEVALERFSNGVEVSKCFKFDILEAMKMSKNVWGHFSAKTISNSWRHTGILAEESDRNWNWSLGMLAENAFEKQ
ncbi:hypothetical protein Ae201684P_009681 [Aphanomyces euteiches]|nr:hypothetical protein Ae201684P_009681 [Aphanomyces euteiches]